MTIISVFPPIENIQEFNDFVARAGWHFAHLSDVEFNVPLKNYQLQSLVASIPEGFDPKIRPYVEKFLNSVKYLTVLNSEEEDLIIKSSDVILKRIEGNQDVDARLKGVKSKIYRVDPVKVRQEGSFYIQAAFDAVGGHKEEIEKCKKKFIDLKNKIGTHKKAWVLATGPSIEGFDKFNYEDALVIACNSTVLNKKLMEITKPKILVFADPIFHFGVSQYAGKFREVVADILTTTEISIVVPFKYYQLLVSKFPLFADRIIGVPFQASINFNLNIGENFHVKTTSNILTLLLLPLAATFSDDVGLLGCDGRPLDEDKYFWGHGASVQIGDKMKNIQEVHPGFFDIDYNEYYFEHCHTLENLILEGEGINKKFVHYGKSYIPALRDRSSILSLDETLKSTPECCVLLEPDGLKTDGHYVRWHNQLLEVLDKEFDKTIVLCNKKQDPELYFSEAHKVFTSHSWGVSRSPFSFDRNFMSAPSLGVFKAELFSELKRISDNSKISAISVFIYYGSVQILKVLHDVKKELSKIKIKIKITLCLFHESVILDKAIDKPRFPPNAKEILLEAAAQVDEYSLLTVTEELSKHVFERFGVRTLVLPNPTPALSDKEQDNAKNNNKKLKSATNCRKVFFPCSLRDEKGGVITKDFLSYLRERNKNVAIEYLFRGSLGQLGDSELNIQHIPDHVNDDEYRSNMESSDIVVIPYLPPHFKYRTSGIIVDALAAGKPCIVINDTWLAEVVKKYRAGLSIKYLSNFTISSAISVIAKNYDFFACNAADGFGEYLSDNSWESMSNLIVK